MDWKPAGYTSLSPYLVTRHAQAIIDFVERTLEATPLRRYDSADGRIMHAEMRIDDSVLMLGDPGDDSAAEPCHLHVYVPDVDRAYALALENGGEAVQPPTRREGEADRRGGVRGPGGNTWWFSTQLGGEKK